VKKALFLALIAASLLAACQSSAPVRQITKGEVLHTFDFTGAGSFEEGIYDGASLTIMNGVYQIDVTQGDNILWWGQWGENYTDTIIDVVTAQQSEPVENAYGVMCRVDGGVGQNITVDPTLAAIMVDSTMEPTAEMTPEAAAEMTAEATAELTDTFTIALTDEAAATAEAPSSGLLTQTPGPTAPAFSQGNGYAFLIQGSGSFAIMKAHGRVLTPLVDWRPSEAINRGPAQNRIRAICVGSYLALYVNDQFLADATDDTYASGQVGLAASAANRIGARIVFDNLTISAPAS
jgi:hypothetical protein